MAHVQDSIEKVYANFEDYETGPEGGEVSAEFLDTAVATKINDFIKPKTCKSYGVIFDNKRNRNVTYHKIPSNLNVKQAWLQCIRREENSTFKVWN